MISVAKSTICSLLLFFQFALYAQITFTHAPKDGAFLARDLKSNIAKYQIEGDVTDKSYSTLTIEIYRDNRLERKYQMSLSFTNGKAPFRRPIALTAGKHSYSIKYILNGIGTWTSRINNIQVGDAYIIQGQSNSVASNFSGAGVHANAFKDKYIRSFGSNSPNARISESDSFWHDAEGDLAGRSGSIGQWGMVLAKSLLDSFNTPICILNGGVGGTRISLHQRDPNNHENTGTIYGRLLRRVRQADLDNGIRGIFYYQGESDGPFAVHHDTMFKRLHGFWKEDFPNFEKLFVVQVREGCGNPSMQLREFQRQFEFNLPNCQTISSNGLNGHDGCHFKFEQGYKELGLQIAALAARDFYNSPHTKNINPPNIKDCFYSNETKTEITLDLQYPDDEIFVDSGFYNLFRIEGDPSVRITGGRLLNNRIVLELNKNSCLVTGLSYDGLRRVQPWVKNKIGTALISFYNQPIKYHKVQTEYEGCKNSPITLGEDSLPGSQYLWTRLLTNQTYTNSKISIVGKQTELFSLVIHYPKSNCKKNDTLRVRLKPENIQLPKLGRDTTLCKGDSLKIQLDSTAFAEFAWYQNSRFERGHTFISSEKGPIRVEAMSESGCRYKDTVHLNLYKAKVNLPEDFSICPGNDTLLETSREYASYLWNGVMGSSKYRTSAAKVLLTVSDSFGCLATDSIHIIEQKIPLVPNLDTSVCENSFIAIKRPNKFTQWYHADTIIKTNLNVHSSISYPVVLIDSFGCLQRDTITTKALPVPKYNLGKDTGYCKLDSLILYLPGGMSKYFVNGKEQVKSEILIKNPGKIYTSVVNTQGCSSSDTIEISEYKVPSLTQFRDTLVCVGIPITFKLETDLTYTVNSGILDMNYVFKDSGRYVIQAMNIKGCSQHKSIRISYKPCSNNANYYSKPGLSIFPNPSHGDIHIRSNEALQKHITLLDANGRTVYQSLLSGKEHFINAHLLNSGLYILKIGNESFKIILY